MDFPIFNATGPQVFRTIPSQIRTDEAAIKKHIEYYFSDENLRKDTYVRRQMDKEGWVPASLIACFNRIKQMTCNVSDRTKFILDLLQNSEIIEVQGDKIRRRGDWSTWLLPADVPDTKTNNDGASSESTGSIRRFADFHRGKKLMKNESNLQI